jgi:hypothetical protein
LHRLDRDKLSRMDKLELRRRLKNGTIYLNKGRVFHRKKGITDINLKMNKAYEGSLGASSLLIPHIPMDIRFQL